MAWLVGDSFDFYATAADASTFWDANDSNWSLVAGRFTGSNCMATTGTSGVVNLTKSSGSNNATHHVVCAFQQTLAIAGTTLGRYFQLLDGTTGQVCIVFRTDGAILLTSGTPAGTILATYTGAFAQNVWSAFEFEITIDNTAGAFHVRKDGATSDSFAATGLNTRPGTNAWANKLQVGLSGNVGGNAHKTDDLLWFSTSGAAPNTWVGDIRSIQLMPTDDTAQKQFSPFPSSLSVVNVANIGWGVAYSANTAYAFIITPTTTGTFTTVTLANLRVGFTGHLNVALYDTAGTGGTPKNLIATATAITNPVSGSQTFTFGSAQTLTKGTAIAIVLLSDTSTGNIDGNSGGATITSISMSYAGGFVTWGTSTISTGSPALSLTLNETIGNAASVSETQEDGDTTYVFDNVVGHNDLYNVADLASVPLSIVGVQTRAMVRKSDAGARTAEVQLKSGATTVTSTPLLLSTTYQYTSRIDTVDPNTSAAWTGTAVNAIQIGPVVQA